MNGRWASDTDTLLDLRPLEWRELLDSALSTAERERLTILGRATLLDWLDVPFVR